MKPRKPTQEEPQGELFRIELEQLIDTNHPLVKSAAVMDWAKFDKAFDRLFDDQTGRPPIPTRLMVGLHCLSICIS